MYKKLYFDKISFYFYEIKVKLFQQLHSQMEFGNEEKKFKYLKYQKSISVIHLIMIEFH